MVSAYSVSRKFKTLAGIAVATSRAIMTEYQKLSKDASTTAYQICLWSLYALLITMSSADEVKPCSVIGFPPVSSEAQLQELQEIPLLDFFIGPSMHSASEVMACGESKEKLLQLLGTQKIQPEILVEDISIMGRSRDYFGDIPLGTMDWNDYHGLENIYTWLDKVVKEYPKLISMQVIGKTYENREIRAYKIEKTGGSRSLKATYFECLIHAREWTISGVCTYIINELTASSSKYSELLEEMRFYIVPVVNPDGFVYTNGTGHDFWRKNRRPIPANEQVTCSPPLENIGVDLNRNWPFQWRDDQKDPCAQDYPGVKGVVEAEVKAVTEFILKHNDIDTFIDIHCCSQHVLLPWAYTRDRAPNYDELINLGQVAADAAKSVAGTIYIPGQIPDLLSPAFGSSADWAYGARKLKFSFGLEMRRAKKTGPKDAYQSRFRVPIDQILPTVKEAWMLVQVLALKRKPDPNYVSVGARPKVCAALLSVLLEFCYINVGYRVGRLST